jgi:hypothetical protein
MLDGTTGSKRPVEVVIEFSHLRIRVVTQIQHGMELGPTTWAGTSLGWDYIYESLDQAGGLLFDTGSHTCFEAWDPGIYNEGTVIDTPSRIDHTPDHPIRTMY